VYFGITENGARMATGSSVGFHCYTNINPVWIYQMAI
jgi:hypothetical protein